MHARLATTLLAAALLCGCEKIEAITPPTLPVNKPIKQVHWLEQNWSDRDRFWFHHATQGTSTLPMPYDWFVALEQPRIWFLGNPPMLKDPAYLRRFGFIPSPKYLSTDPGTRRRYGYGGADERDGGGQAVPYDAAAFPGNPDGLPVGFARTPGYPDPAGKKDPAGNLVRHPDQIGFTCAACHTGHLEFDGVSVRIDGAPAMTALGKFRKAMVLALVYTDLLPGRFSRFAERVLGAEHTDQQRQRLEKRLEARIEGIRAVVAKKAKILEERRKAAVTESEAVPFTDVAEGFGRLDALNRIGNEVFYLDLQGAGDQDPDFKVEANLRATHAPVNFPPIWTTPWFAWAQYDASVLQPLIRNVGEALGVAAKINLLVPNDGNRPLYRSSVRLAEIDHMEKLLQGPDPFSGSRPGFKGLTAPKWPSRIFKHRTEWQIDPRKVAEGRKLYRERCEECHLPPVNDPEYRSADGTTFWTSETWQSVGGSGRKYLKLVEKKAADIGTDPAQAKILYERVMQLPSYLKSGQWRLCGKTAGAENNSMRFGAALMVLVEKTVDRWFDDAGKSPEERQALLGDRPNCPSPNFGIPMYKARPLNGVWATAPYLHNGSVPNLWALLSPTPGKDRPERFCVGSREFDPKKVGYRTDFADCELNGLFMLDTGKPGNSNRGHAFTAKGEERPRGVLGQALTDEQRWSLIEYLKTL